MSRWNRRMCDLVGKKDIKIFVSHRIDLDSVTIDNPLYVPVYCGAVYKDKSEWNPDIIGDDTGDNISQEREKFCELTVMYWAWKNQQADYYGLCHYRRYLSFAQEKFDIDYNNKQHVVENELNGDAVKKYGLLNEKIQEEIKENDCIIIEPIDITKVNTPEGCKKNILEHWKSWEKYISEEGAVEKLLKCIRKIKPHFYENVMDYLSTSNYFGFNCFVLKNEIFLDLCDTVFPILFELDKNIDYKYKSEVQTRTCGFMGEILVGAYIYGLMKNNKEKISCKQLVYFENTKKDIPIYPKFKDEIPVIITSSDYYTPYAGCLIKSIINFSSDDLYYDIIVLSKDMDEKHRDRLIAIGEGNANISIRVHNPASVTKDTTLYVSHPMYSEVAYYRILAPWILKKFDKILILDADIITKIDVSFIYQIELEGKIIAGVKDAFWQGMLWEKYPGNWFHYAKKEMKMRNPYDYINTGVLIMDLNGVREEYTLEYTLKYISEHKFRFQEQDVINVLFEDKIKFLDETYNYYVQDNDIVLEAKKSIPLPQLKKWEKAKRNPKVVHYCGKPKPWETPKVLFGDVFWSIARETVFYEEIVSNMCEFQINRKVMDCGCADENYSTEVRENIYARFKFPFDIVKPGARIIIYGGGIVGKIFVKQLSHVPYCRIVAWCDKNPEQTGVVQFPIITPRQLTGIPSSDYDIILVAIERPDVARQIRDELQFFGIPNDKIKWVNPSVYAR